MNDLSEIPHFLDRTGTKPLVYTFSNLNAYRNCGHAMYRRYIKRDQKYVETPEIKWGNDVHAAMEHRVGSGKPLPAEMHGFEHFATPLLNRNAVVELKLAMTRKGEATGFWDSDCFFRGKVDVAMIQNDKAFVVDWKTGSSRFEDPFELETGALLLKAKYPEIGTIKGNYVWLKEDRAGQVYDLSCFRETWNTIIRLVNLIEGDRLHNAFEKRKSGLCSWCSVSDCENWRPRGNANP